MKEMEVTLFNPQGTFCGTYTVNGNNFIEMVAFFGTLLCAGSVVKIADITYTPVKLPEFLADMHRINKNEDFSYLFDTFSPYLDWIKYYKFCKLSEYISLSPEFVRKVEEAIDADIAKEINK